MRLWCLAEDGSSAFCVGYGQRHTAAIGSVHFGQMSSEIFASAGQDNCIKLWKLPSKFTDG